jgi:hypothetical protein
MAAENNHFTVRIKTNARNRYQRMCEFMESLPLFQ